MPVPETPKLTVDIIIEMADRPDRPVVLIERRESLRRKRDLAFAQVADLFRCVRPQGAFYLFPDISDHLRKGETSADFAVRILETAGVAYEGYMVAIAAAMETPPIMVALWLAKDTTAGSTFDRTVLREVFLNGSIVVLVGSFVIGLITGAEGLELIASFIVSPFQGALCLFLFFGWGVITNLLFHAMGWGLPFTAMMLGSKQVMPHRFLDAASLLDLFESEEVTISAGVPTIWQSVRSAIQAEPDTQLAIVAQLRVGIEWQMVGEEADIRGHQPPDPSPLHADQRPGLVAPEITVVHQDGIGPGVVIGLRPAQRLLGRCPGGGHPTDHVELLAHRPDVADQPVEDDAEREVVAGEQEHQRQDVEEDLLLLRERPFERCLRHVLSHQLALQVVGEVAEPLKLPEWTVPLVVVLLGIGFPVALVLAWAFEVTPDGVKKTANTQSRSYVFAALAAVLLAAGGYYYYKDSGPAPEVAPDVPPETQSAPTLPPANDKSIAVLPFVDMSAAGDQEYLGDGITEEILNVLVHSRDLRVVGRTSSFAFKGSNQDLRAIGEALGVAYILEGSIRKAGERVRVTAQLVKAADGFHLWSNNYDSTAADTISVQENIAERIAVALDVVLDEQDFEAVPLKTVRSDHVDQDRLLDALRQEVLAAP